MVSSKLTRDIVVFPYTVDYMIELGNNTEMFIVGNSPNQSAARHVKSKMGEDAKVSELGYNKIRVEHLNI
jgi:hypothetical protein